MSESTSVDNDCVVTAVMNIDNVSVMEGAAVVINNDGVVWLLVVHVNKGIVVSVMNVNECVMGLLMGNVNIIVVVSVDINNGGMVMVILNNNSLVGSVNVLSDDDCVNNWLVDGFNNDCVLDNWLNNGLLLVIVLLFNVDIVIVASIDSFLVYFNVNVIL